jgi:hypothetical protein
VDQILDSGIPVQQYEPNARGNLGTTTTFNSAQLDLQSINGIRFLAVDAKNEWRTIAMA